MNQCGGGTSLSQMNIHGFCNAAAGFAGSNQPEAVGQFFRCQSIVIRNVAAGHGFGSVPKAVSTHKMVFAIRGEFFCFGAHHRQQIGTAKGRKVHNTRAGSGKRFHAQEAIFKDTGG